MREQIDGYIINLFSFFFLHQGKKGGGDPSGEAEQKKFDATGHDSDLVDSLERDIVSRNPNVHWYGRIHRVLLYKHFTVWEVFFLFLSSVDVLQGRHC